MNRRELAKKGFMAVCGFVCAKLPNKPDTASGGRHLILTSWGVMYNFADGKFAGTTTWKPKCR